MCFWKHWRVKRRRGSCYPESILPSVEYVVRIDIDDLLDKVGEFVVSRRMKGTVEDNINVFAGQRRLRIEALGRIPNLSLNLLGGAFVEKKHTKFRQIDEATREWNGEAVLMKDYIGKFEELDNCSSVAFRGRDLHRVEVPYKKTIAIKAEKDKLQRLGINLDRFIENNEASLQGIIKLEHKPTMLNYWHMVLEIFPQAVGEPIKRVDAAWQRNMVNFVTQEILTVKFEVNPDPVPSIHKSLYHKKL